MKQITPKIIATCTVGGHVIATTVNPSAASPYYTDYTFNTADPFIWSNGTNNQYPFDTYVAQMNIRCTYTKLSPTPLTGPPANGQLMFWVAVDPYNTGIWMNTFQARRPQLDTEIRVDLKCNVGDPQAVPVAPAGNAVATATATATPSNLKVASHGEILPKTPPLNPSAQFFFKVPLLSVTTSTGTMQQVAGTITPSEVMAGIATTSNVVPTVCNQPAGTKFSDIPSGCICTLADPTTTFCATPPVAFTYLFKAALGLAMGLPASPTRNPLDKTVIDVFFAQGSAARKLNDAPASAAQMQGQPEEEEVTGRHRRKTQDMSMSSSATVVVPVGQPALILSVAIQASGDYNPVTGIGTIGYDVDQLRSLATSAIASGAVTKLIEQLTYLGDSVKASFGTPALGAPVPSDVPWADNSGVFATYGNDPRAKSNCVPLLACVYLDVSKFPLYFGKAFPYNATTYVAGSYLPANDDGNTDADAPVYANPTATDDGHSGASFRRNRELATSSSHPNAPASNVSLWAQKARIDAMWDHDGVETPPLGNHPACDVRQQPTRRSLRGASRGCDVQQQEREQRERALLGVVVPARLIPSNFPTPAPVPGCQPIIEFQQVQIPFALQITTRRAPIHLVFAMFLICAMWMIVASQVLLFLPYYVRIFAVNQGLRYLIIGLAPLIFALTGIRRAMPQSPEIGAIFDFASYYPCLIILTFNMVWIGVNWNLEALNRPAREKAYAAKELQAKMLANKPLAKLTNDEVLLLFANTGRPEWVPALLANNTTGKDLKYATKVDELAGIVPGGPWKKKKQLKAIDLPKLMLIAAIKEWARVGVDRALLVPLPPPAVAPAAVVVDPPDKPPRTKKSSKSSAVVVVEVPPSPRTKNSSTHPGDYEGNFYDVHHISH